MTTLLVEELKTELIHEFNITTQYRNILGGLYPYIAMYNAPAGTFRVALIKNDVEIFFNTFTSDDIKAALSTPHVYAHVWYPIIPPLPLQLNKASYKVKLTATGYTYSDESFIGWVRQHENLNNKLSYVPAQDSLNPLALRIKTLEGRKS